MCKFCGFAQEVTGYVLPQSGDKPYRWVMVQCVDCSRQSLLGVYDWKVPFDTSPKRCGNCQKDMIEVKWPSDARIILSIHGKRRLQSFSPSSSP